MMDPEKIYPKRLGRTKDCKLVLEYYNVALDCFKKHAIPYDPSIPAKAAVKQIYGDLKHSVYLKKVDPANLEAVLMGKSINVPEKYGRNPNQNFPNERIENLVEQSPYVPIVPEVKRQEVQKPTVQIEPDANYDQDFEDFEASQSLGKKAPVPQPVPVEKPKKAKQEKKVEEVENTFEFIEETPKGEKKKKEKSKEKKEKKEKKPKKEKKQTKEEPPIEEEFQFL